jgi:hypothetical protein
VITDGLPPRQPCRVVDCGQPWHGLASAGELDYGGASPMTWITPDSGDCWVVRVPGAPGSVQATPLNPDHEWLDYGLLSGWWERQLYGHALPGGRLSYLYAEGVGDTYIVNLSGLTFKTSNTKLGGTVTLKSTNVAASPPAAINLTTNDLTLDAARHIFDVVAINADGSEAIIGCWPSSTGGNAITYRADEQNRGAACVSVGGTAYRPVPPTLVKLVLTATTATLSLYKAATEVVGNSNSGSQTLGDSLYFNQHTVDTVTHSGPGDICTRHDWVVDYLGSTGSCTYTCTSHTEPETSLDEWEYETRILIGHYYTAAGVLTPVELVATTDYTLDSAAAVIGDHLEWVEGTEWNGSNCEDVSTPAPDPDPMLGFEVTYTLASTLSVSIQVGGSAKSTLTVDCTDSGTINRDPYGVLISSSDSPASDLDLDGTTLSTALSAATANYSSHGWLAAIDLPGLCTVHAVRYSNHAYGLMVTGLAGAHPAYLGGVCNLVADSRAAAVGWVDAPDDTVEYPYTERRVSIHPDDGTVSAGLAVRCWV